MCPQQNTALFWQQPVLERVYRQKREDFELCQEVSVLPHWNISQNMVGLVVFPDFCCIQHNTRQLETKIDLAWVQFGTSPFQAVCLSYCKRLMYLKLFPMVFLFLLNVPGWVGQCPIVLQGKWQYIFHYALVVSGSELKTVVSVIILSLLSDV